MHMAILTPKLDFRAGSGTVAWRIELGAEGRVFERDEDLETVLRAGSMRPQFLNKAQVWQLSEIGDAEAGDPTAERKAPVTDKAPAPTP
jgi:thymidine kinase